MNLSMSWKKWVAILVGLLFLIGIGAFLAFPYYEPKLRAEMVRAIEQRFDGKAEVESLDVSIFPSVQGSGKKFQLWYKGRKDIPPMISMDQFTVSAGFFDLFTRPIRVDQVTLKGLVIQIPPKEVRKSNSSQTKAAVAGQTKPVERASSPKSLPVEKFPFVIREIHADGTVLKILPGDPQKDPLIFELYKLNLHSVALNRPMKFDAVLKNAKPAGLINTSGEFGPWRREDPGQTPVSGKYTFKDADLSVFKGISGKLSSVGQYQGVLERIDARGTTDTPDFMVRTGNQPVHLTTEFHAIIDGTNGDTLLQPVTARFGNTLVVCRGGVVKKEGIHGKWVILDVQVNKGKMEDLLKFAIPGKPPLVGSIQFKAKLELPPGDVDVVEKLYLKGTFNVDNGKFTSSTVQDKIDTLSMRSRGIHAEDTTEQIVSDLKGEFLLDKGQISFSTLSFIIPGAQVTLNGNYNLVKEEIDFRGTLRMQATISQTQKGIKGVLLKIVDPFFKKDGAGAVIPIKITGTRDDPKFGLNIGGK